jgi:hypothetical protein
MAGGGQSSTTLSALKKQINQCGSQSSIMQALKNEIAKAPLSPSQPLQDTMNNSSSKKRAKGQEDSNLSRFVNNLNTAQAKTFISSFRSQGLSQDSNPFK